MKKLLSILAAVAMLVAMLPTAAFAAGATAEVYTLDDFKDALNNPSVTEIIFMDDIESSDTNPAASGADEVFDASGKTIDLNSYTLYVENAPGKGCSMHFFGNNFTIKNGTIEETLNGRYALHLGDYYSYNRPTSNVLIEDIELVGGVNVYYATDVVLRNVTATSGSTDGAYVIWCDVGGHVTVESGTFTASASNTALVGAAASTSPTFNASLTIEGGKFVTNGKSLALDSANSVAPVISGGTYDVPVPEEYCAENFIPVTEPNADGEYVVTLEVKDLAALETGKSTIVIVAEGVKLASKNGFTTVTFLATVDGEDYYLVTAAETTVERTEVLTTKVGDADAVDAYFINIVLPVVDPEDPKDLGEFLGAVGSVAYIQAGNDGISADAYNEAKETGKEKIVIVMDNSWGYIVLYRGDYTKLNIKEDILFNIAAVALEVDNDLHNAVLDTLGNDKVDPLYIVMENNDLSKVASKPEIKLNLNDYSEGEGLEDWLWNNGTSNLTLMKYTAKTDDADATVAIVAKGLALDSIQNKFMTLSLTEAGVYFLLPAADAVVPEAPAEDDETDEKPNASTGANDMAAAAIAFAVIAIAAGISKKVK